MFAGLPELGISNGEDLKETLTNCTDPLKAIDQFQVTVILVTVFLIHKLVLVFTMIYTAILCRHFEF